MDFLFPVRSGTEPLPGSNAWAIAGSHTASGKPLLSNDPHLEYSLPGIWYMAHLQAPGLDVAGVALPGVPGVVVGHNQRIAWGITNLQFDVQDLYIEKFDDRTGRYLYRGQVEQARAERELIRVKGQKPVELVDLGDAPRSVDRHRRQRPPGAALDGGAAGHACSFPFIDIDRAQNWQQFTAALARCPGPGSNFVYADVDGNIGYHAAGKLPIARVIAATCRWMARRATSSGTGFIPFDESAHRLQSAQRHHRHGQPESVSRWTIRIR